MKTNKFPTSAQLNDSELYFVPDAAFLEREKLRRWVEEDLGEG